MSDFNEKLPEMCYATDSTTNRTVIIFRGTPGFCRTEDQESPDLLNADLGVTPAQARAMLHGSMMGWDTPGADPDNWIMLNPHTENDAIH